MPDVDFATLQKDPDLNGLVPEFREKVERLLAACHNRGVVMIPTCGVRTVFDQAKAYRQSRSSSAIAATAAKLRSDGAPFLAEALISVGPQKGALGRHVTKALPGLSWHQWGLAVDCAWMVDGKINWSVDQIIAGQNGYRAYAELADDFGVFSGGAMWGWDFPHVQAVAAGSPQRQHTLAQIDAEMKRRYG